MPSQLPFRLPRLLGCKVRRIGVPWLARLVRTLLSKVSAFGARLAAAAIGEAGWGGGWPAVPQRNRGTGGKRQSVVAKRRQVLSPGRLSQPEPSRQAHHIGRPEVSPLSSRPSRSHGTPSTPTWLTFEAASPRVLTINRNPLTPGLKRSHRCPMSTSCQPHASSRIPQSSSPNRAECRTCIGISLRKGS